MRPEPWFPVAGDASRGLGFRSPFGGLWPDLHDAPRWLEGMHTLGLLDDASAAQFRFWIEHGWVSLPGAVPAADIDALEAAVERVWRDGEPRCYVESFQDRIRVDLIRPEMRDRPHKVLDLHALLPEARRVCAAGPVLQFLQRLFLRPPMAFQSLYFTRGTGQDMHQDTAYVPVSSPLEFAGVWIALQDVQPGTGELQYFDGSHRIPEFLFHGKWRSKPSSDPVDEPFLRHVYTESVARGCDLRVFRPRRGDVLIWHADLVHGGSKAIAPGSERRSLVTHFCPVDVAPSWRKEGVAHMQPRRDPDTGLWLAHYWLPE